MARKESDDKSRRITRKHLELAQSGESRVAAPDPSAISPTAAARPERSRRRSAKLSSESSLATAFALSPRTSRSGHPRLVGGQWSAPSPEPHADVGARLSAPAGPPRRDRRAGEWEAILTAQETARLRAILGDPDRSIRRTPRRYLWRGLLHCATATRFSSPGRRARHTPLRLCQGPGAYRLRPDRRHRGARRATHHGRRSVPARHARTRDRDGG